LSKHQYKNKEHLIWVKQQPCAIAGCRKKNVVAHHLLKPFDGHKGMGMKANDRNAIPLCNDHHVSLHTQHGSERSFFKAHGFSEDTGKILAEELWNASPHNEEQTATEIDSLPF
jgi:hypothetical protein